MAIITFDKNQKKDLGQGLLQAGIGVAGSAAGNFISGGNSTKLGQLTQQFGSAAAAAIPGIGGAIVGAGAGILGGVFNALGTKRNEKNIAAVKDNISQLNNYQADASDYDSFTQQVANSPVAMHFNNNFLGKNGWLSHSIDNMADDFRNQQAEGTAHVNKANYENGINIGETKTNALLAGNFALGGNLSTHGGNFSSGLTYINTGGTHESNPNQGIPISTDGQGNINRVEQGEVLYKNLYNDYVFSNRLLVPSEVRYKLKLGNKNNMTYADAAKKLNKEAKERPNDPISKNGIQGNLSILAQSQEQQKQLELMRQQEYMKQLKQLQGNSGEYIGYPSQSSNLYPLGGKPKKVVPLYTESPMATQYVVPGQATALDADYDDNYMFPFDGTIDIPDRPAYTPRVQYGPKASKEHTQMMNILGSDETEVENGNTLFNTLRAETANLAANSLEKIRKNSKTLKAEAAKKDALAKTYLPWWQQKDAKTNNNKLLPTWMRKAPLYATGIMGFTDAMGWTNKPDYSDADAAINLYKTPGMYEPVKFNPIGNYVSYDPYDIDYAATKANALSAAGLRNIYNTSGGNRGVAMAGTLAANYNSEGALGEILRSAYQYNLSNKLSTAGFNKNTDQFNSEGYRATATANQQAKLQAKSAYLQGMLGAYQLRQQAKQQALAARSTNMSNFINSLGDLGRENFMWNQISTNPGIYYSYNKDGGFTYDPTKNIPNNKEKVQG